MRALRFDGAVTLQNVETPEPGPKEALVRVEAAGICNTDLEIARGYMGFRGTLGHEFVGVVERHSDMGWIGRRVVSEINASCGRCASCIRGLPRHCSERTVVGILGRDGCFAERVVVPEANLHAVPAELPNETAIFVEPVAAAFEILEQVTLIPQTRTLVLGDGKLGLLAAMVIRLTGCKLAVLGRHPRKLGILERLGIPTYTEATLYEIERRDFDVVVEATGAPEGLGAAMGFLRPRGVLVLKSTFHGETKVDIAQLVVDEMQVIGSRCGPFEPAIAALQAGQVDPRPLIDARFPLSEGVGAMKRAAQRGTLKVMLEMS